MSWWVDMGGRGGRGMDRKEGLGWWGWVGRACGWVGWVLRRGRMWEDGACQRLYFQVEEDAGHHELACLWGWIREQARGISQGSGMGWMGGGASNGVLKGARRGFGAKSKRTLRLPACWQPWLCSHESLPLVPQPPTGLVLEVVWCSVLPAVSLVG